MKLADYITMTDSIILQNETVPYRLKAIVIASKATAGWKC